VTNESMSPEDEPRRSRSRPSRSEKFAKDWADSVYVELLEEWGRADEGPMPTRADAEREARERTELLLDGLGEWAQLSPKVLDLNHKTARRVPRGWRRNAWPRREPGDGDGWWRFLFGDED
jgi:hypothetical protein